MRNKEVIENYFNFMEGRSSNGNLYTRDNKLINYATPLVIYYNGIFTINTKKYSVTTSKIQSYIKNYVASHNLQNVIFSDLF